MACLFIVSYQISVIWWFNSKKNHGFLLKGKDDKNNESIDLTWRIKQQTFFALHLYPLEPRLWEQVVGLPSNRRWRNNVVALLFFWLVCHCNWYQVWNSFIFLKSFKNNTVIYTYSHTWFGSGTNFSSQCWRGWLRSSYGDRKIGKPFYFKTISLYQVSERILLGISTSYWLPWSFLWLSDLWWWWI